MVKAPLMSGMVFSWAWERGIRLTPVADAGCAVLAGLGLVVVFPFRILGRKLRQAQLKWLDSQRLLTATRFDVTPHWRSLCAHEE